MCTRNDIWRSTLVAASLFFVATRAACFADDQSKPVAASPAAEPPVVAVSKPVEREVTDSEVFAGRIEAAQSVNVVSRATGYLTKAAFKEGADVKKGDVLFEIDARPYQAQVERAQAEVRVNEARLQAARAELDRSSENAKTGGAISRQELDKSRSLQEEALAALDAAKSNLRAHQLTLGFCTVVAPINGRVGRYNLTPGNLVTQDQTVLTTIVSLDPVYAYFDVDERTLLRMRKANDANGRHQSEPGAETPALLNLADENGFPHRGTVNFVGNHVDAATGTISMRAVFANPESKNGTRLYVPGMFARVQLPIGKPHSSLLVMNPALGSDQGVRFVYVAGPNNVVERRQVKSGGLQEDGLRVIDSGLQPDDRVIVGDVRQVHPSMTIQPKLIPMPTNGPGK